MDTENIVKIFSVLPNLLRDYAQTIDDENDLYYEIDCLKVNLVNAQEARRAAHYALREEL